MTLAPKIIDRPARLSDEVASGIASLIVQEGMKPGERLPTEGRFAKIFGVSRAVVREAIADLRQQGIVQTRQGVGAFVAQGSAKTFQIATEGMRTIEDLRPVMELRIGMEVEAAALAARRRTSAQLARLRAALDAIRTAPVDETLPHERAFHAALAEATQNPHYRDFMQFLAARINASLVAERQRSPRTLRSAQRVVREYESLFEAICAGDPDHARRASWVHLLRVADRLGLRGLMGWEESRMNMLGDRDIPLCAAPDPDSRAPRFAMPKGAVDCHFHVFGPESVYPYVRQRTYTPPDAPLSAYLGMAEALGLQRGVIVQPSVYGTDNRATLDALRRAGPQFRGVVVVNEAVPRLELERMHEAGVRGVRINLLFKSGIEVSDVRRLAERIAPLGWHLQMLIDVSEFSDLAETLGQLPVEVVFDHLGHMPTSIGLRHPGFQAMLGLLASGRCWTKLSGAYRITTADDLPYEDVAPYAREIIRANSERVVWATDWPHPYVNTSMPNDGALLDMLDDWAPDAATRDRILTRNAWELYDFEPPER